MSNPNSVTARFYDINGSELVDSDRDGVRARVQHADTAYIGGFGSAEIVIDRDPVRALPFAQAARISLHNGPTMIWYGWLAQDGRFVSDSGSGVRLSATGTWGHIMTRRVVDKRWADDRLSSDVWIDAPPSSGGYSDINRDKFTTDRTNRLRIEPKAGALAVNDGRSITYTMPTGQTVKRATLSYNMQEGAQQYTLRLFNLTAFSNVWAVTASGSGTRDDTLGTPSQTVVLQLYSNAAQTAVADGTLFGQVDSAVSGSRPLMVYSETGYINAYEIFRDVRAMVPELSSSDTAISSALTSTLEPFYTQGPETLASILARAAAFGTPSAGEIAYGCRDIGGGSIGLFAEAFPAISDWDIEVNLRDPNVVGSAEVVRDIDAVANWIPLVYTGPDGVTHTITPDDNSSLKDDASIATYGKRTPPGGALNVGQADITVAVGYAYAYLQKYKTPQVIVSGPITLKGYALGKGGSRIPVANLLHKAQYGMRVKIVNFAADIIGVPGAGMTAVVSHAAYNDSDGGTISLSFGVPDSLPILLARLARPSVNVRFL